MKKTTLLFALIYLPFTFSNAQWVKQLTSDSTYFNAIQFLNENTGYIVGEVDSDRGSIYKTTNYGVNWVKLQTSPYINIALWNLSFINVNTGYVCGYNSKIFKTTDGGLNWTYSLAPSHNVAQSYQAIKFFDENTGYLGGRDGLIVKTTNGGINWNTLIIAYNDINSFYFFDINTGIMDTYGGQFYKTTNAGVNWNNYLSYYSFYHLDFVDNNTGFASGFRVYKSTNSGNSWFPISPSSNWTYSLSVINNSIIYSGLYDSSHIYKTTNGGTNWIKQPLPIQPWYPVESIFFVNENTGFSCANHSIFKTTNGGNVFINNISTEIPDGFKLFQNYPNPFNPSTNIRYQITDNNFVSLKVFDILGKEITTLVDETQKPGIYEVQFDGSNLPSGVYFYNLTSIGMNITKKMLLSK
jgi:photosystem II stability/assembly factor-like uncharacterized protein